MSDLEKSLNYFKGWLEEHLLKSVRDIHIDSAWTAEDAIKWNMDEVRHAIDHIIENHCKKDG